MDQLADSEHIRTPSPTTATRRMAHAFVSWMSAWMGLVNSRRASFRRQHVLVLGVLRPGLRWLSFHTRSEKRDGVFFVHRRTFRLRQISMYITLIILGMIRR